MMLLLLSQDLMITARVETAARQYGLIIKTVGTAITAIELVSRDECRLLLVDLRLPGLEIASFVQAVRDGGEAHVPIIACAPHVHEAKLSAAREAGCDAVITRGQLDRELEDVITQLRVL